MIVMKGQNNVDASKGDPRTTLLPSQRKRGVLYATQVFYLVGVLGCLVRKSFFSGRVEKRAAKISGRRTKGTAHRSSARQKDLGGCNALIRLI
jgi:hypothetical protein